MVIAVWGRDGIGKSTLCDALGVTFSKRGVVAVIDTDLTQPTLPMRLNRLRFDADTSLGKAVSGVGVMNAAPYLHQHPKRKSLFYAGLVDGEDYMAYEAGLDADDNARDFVEQCKGLADTVILDVSGQRNDPFLPGALMHSDMTIVLVTPDVQGVCWLESVKPLLHNMNAKGRVLPVAAMADRHHDIPAAEKAAGIRFAAALPFARELRRFRDTGASPLDGVTLAAILYRRQTLRLCEKLKEVGE